MARRLSRERVRAVIAHAAPHRPPIRIVQGDTVVVEKRDDEWPAFVFVCTQRGGKGWVPARLLSAETGEATVIEGYDTQELSTEIGEVMDVVTRDDASGWVWCRNGAGAEGWVPVNTIEATGG